MTGIAAGVENGLDLFQVVHRLGREGSRLGNDQDGEPDKDNSHCDTSHIRSAQAWPFGAPGRSSEQVGQQNEPIISHGSRILPEKSPAEAGTLERMFCGGPFFLTKGGRATKKTEAGPPSSSGLGCLVLSQKTGVRVPLGVFCTVLLGCPGKRQKWLVFRGFLLEPGGLKRLRLSLRISPDIPSQAKVWAKVFWPDFACLSVRSRGDQGADFPIRGAGRDRQCLHGRGQVVEPGMGVTRRQGIRRMPGQVLM